MPAAIPYIAAALAPAGYATAAYLMAGVAVAIYQRDRAESRASRAKAAFDASRAVNIRSATSARRLLLGQARVFGRYAYAEFVGTNQEYFDQIIACTDNEISVQGVYFDDELVPVANIVANRPTSGKYANNAVVRETEERPIAGSTFTTTFTPTSSDIVVSSPNLGTPMDPYTIPYTFVSVVGNTVTIAETVTGTVQVVYTRVANQNMLVQWALGTASQASTSWAGISTPKWTANHRLRGSSYVRTLMAIDESVYANGLPQVSLLATGNMPVWDPRAGGGAGANVTGTRNPALLAAWYRTLPKADGGMGIPTTWIDWPSVAAAANICDELITVKKLDGSGTETIARYTCDTVLECDRPRRENLQVILNTMAGDFPFTGGLYKCFAGAYRAPILTITDADLTADSELEFLPSTGGYANPPNIMGATIFDAAKNYNETGTPEVVNSAYVTADGGEEIDELRLNGVTDSRRANYLQGVRLEQGRPAHILRGELGGVGADLGLYDCLQVNATGYAAFASKTFEIRRWANLFNGRYRFEAHQVKSSTYALDADRYTPVSATPPTDISYIWNVTKPANVVVASGPAYRLTHADGTVVSRLKVTWDLHPQAYVRDSGHIQVAWRRLGLPDWTIEPELPGAVQVAYLWPVIDGAYYEVLVRATNASGGYSDWTVVTPQLAVPSDPAGSAAVNLVADGTAGAVAITGQEVRRVAGTPGWNAGAHSASPIAGACEAAATVRGLAAARFIGLSSTPAVDGGYTSMNYALLAQADGSLSVYEAGVFVAGLGAYADGDRLAVRYTGPAVEYRRNGVVLYASRAAMGQVLSLDLSLWHLGGSFTQIAFTPLQSKAAEFRVSAVGYNATNLPAGVDGYLVNLDANWNELAPVRSYMMVRISRTTGRVTFSRQYDVYANGTNNAATLAADLNATTSDSVVVVWSYDEPQTNRLSSGLDAAMYRCGATPQVFGASGFKVRSAYVLIGIGGCGPGKGYEAYSGAADNDANARLLVNFQITPLGQLIVDGQSFTGLLEGAVDVISLQPEARGVRRVVTPSAAVTVTAVQHVPDGFTWNTVLAADTPFVAAYNGHAVVSFDGVMSTTSGNDQYSVQDALATYDAWKVKFVPSGSGSPPLATTRTFTLVKGQTYQFEAVAAKLSGTTSVSNMQLTVEVTYTG